MKKTATRIGAVLLLLSLLMVQSFAGGEKATAAELQEKTKATAAYVMAQYLATTVQGEMYKNAQYIALVGKSGVDCRELTDLYRADLKTVLDTNDGKLLYDGAESGGSYALAIEALEAIGVDPSDFYGYDLFDALQNVPAADSNLYMNAYALITWNRHPDKLTNDATEQMFLDAIATAYQENQETGEAGWDNWGLNVDNNGQVIAALAAYYDEDETIRAQIDKAVAYMETQKNEEGYMNYGAANANSTGAALQAYVALNDMEKAAAAYELLQLYKAEDGSGAYLYYGSPNLYASTGALAALYDYSVALAAMESETPTEPETAPLVTVPESQPETAPVTEVLTAPAQQNTGKGIPATGDAGMTKFLPMAVAAISGAALIALRRKQKEA